VIGLADKDIFYASMPKDDVTNFGTFVEYPTLPQVMAAFIPGITAPANGPGQPRADLVATFVTGIGPMVLPNGGNLNEPKHLVRPGEEMRLNTSIPPLPAAQQSRLGVIGDAMANIPMDLAGYPNGRRPGDDVVDISLRVAMGVLCTLSIGCVPADAPSGNLEYTDGAYVDATHFASVFPYLGTPFASSPQK